MTTTTETTKGSIGMPKKVTIIGAGISGLAAGIYLQMNGFETEIIEKHTIPGGLCTGWKRGDFTFDGCIHWLLGSAPGSAFHSLWSELIDFKNISFVNHDIRVSIETKVNADKNGNKVFHFYSNVDKLENYMISLSPEDEKLIRSLTDSIRYITGFDLPPMVDKNPKLRSVSEKIRLLGYLPLMKHLSKWGKITNVVFANKLKSPFLKEVFTALFDGREFSVLAMSMQLVYFNKHCAGYPIGGSLNFARKIEERYISIGGKIQYQTTVNNITVENGNAIGIQTTDNKAIPSDIVISAADWHFTVFDALKGTFTNKTISSLGENKLLEVFDSAVLVSIGMNRTFDNDLHLLRFPLEQTLTLEDGTKISRIEVHIFNYDATLAKPGKTVISVTLPTRNSDFWIKLRNTDIKEYQKIKNHIAEMIIQILDKKYGSFRQDVGYVDVATPATFYRYTSNWKGSIQGWLPSKKLFAPSPVKSTLPGLSNFYQIGHWMEPGGGLPIALLTARNIAQEICHAGKKQFITNPAGIKKATGKNRT